MESTLSIQALKPRMDELKAKYENEPETLQLETARLYKAAGINPLAGCLPTLATIPVFIGLYRCVTLPDSSGVHACQLRGIWSQQTGHAKAARVPCFPACLSL